MQTINLTSTTGGLIFRVNPDHIIAYWYVADHKTSEVITTHESFKTSIKVKETAEEIDKLLSELP